MHGWERVDSKKVGRKGVEGNGRRSGQEEWTGKKVGWGTQKREEGVDRKGREKRVANLKNLVELGLVQELRMTSLHTLKLNGNLLPVGDVYT